MNTKYTSKFILLLIFLSLFSCHNPNDPKDPVSNDFKTKLATRVRDMFKEDPANTGSIGGERIFTDPEYELKLSQPIDVGGGPTKGTLEFSEYNSSYGKLTGTIDWTFEFVVPPPYSAWELRDKSEEIKGLYDFHVLSGKLINDEKDSVFINYSFKVMPREFQRRGPKWEELIKLRSFPSDIVIIGQ